MRTVKEYEIIDHGFKASSYFQGCGTAFTEFEDVATGIGDTAQEAFDDALDQLAAGGWDVSRIKGRSRLSRKTVRTYLLRDVGGLSKEDIEDTETYAHVSVRVR